MKVTVENLGRIQHAEFDWKPFTVFVGENNTNKSWTAYCMYALAKSVLSSEYNSSIEHGVKLSPATFALEDYLRSKISWPLGLKVTREELLQIVRNSQHGEAIYHAFIESDVISDVLGITPENCKESRVSIELDLNNPPISMGSPELVGTSREISGPNAMEEGFVSFRSMRSGGGAYGYSMMKDELDMALPDIIRHQLFTFFQKEFVFPAERTTLVTLGKYLVPSAGTGNEWSMPIRDFLRMLWQQARTSLQRNTPEDKLTRLLHNKILQGSVYFKEDSRTFKFRLSDQSELDLSSASTLAKSLSSLFLLLKNEEPVMGQFDRYLIVIDEPEMNAHPEAQRQITELLSMLVEAGNYVLITTHSPYVVDHLNNLVEASQLPPAEQQRIAEQDFALKSPKAFLQPADVAVYEFTTAGEVRDLFDRTDNLIDTSTFGKVSNQLDAATSHIYDAMKSGD